jgi:hypothetical protein
MRKFLICILFSSIWNYGFSQKDLVCKYPNDSCDIECTYLHDSLTKYLDKVFRLHIYNYDDRSSVNLKKIKKIKKIIINTYLLDSNTLNRFFIDIKDIHMDRLYIVGYHHITLPSNIKYLKKVKMLVLTATSIGNFPIELKEMDSLNTLLVVEKNIFAHRGGGCYNTFRELPEWLCDIKNLKYIQINGGGIIKIPEDYCNCEHIEYIGISNNPLLEIPDCYKKNKKLGIGFGTGKVSDKYLRKMQKDLIEGIDHSLYW